MSIPQHKHCLVCGKSMEIELEGDFCSEKCKQAVAAKKKSQTRTTWIMMIIIGIVLMFFWVIMPSLAVIKPPGR